MQPVKVSNNSVSRKASRFCLPLLTLVCLAFTWPLLFRDYAFQLHFDLWQPPELGFLKQANEQGGGFSSPLDTPSTVRWHGFVPRGRKEGGRKQGGSSPRVVGGECLIRRSGDGNLINGRYLSARGLNGDQRTSHGGGSEKLKVYVYELPDNMTADFYKHPSALKGAHSAEWWIYQDIVHPRSDGSSPAVRVTDPAQADVYLVPFMSTQAFLCADSAQYTLPDHGEVCGDLKGKNHQLANELHTWLELQAPWQRSGGMDHVFLLLHPLALDEKRAFLCKGIFLLTDFVRFWSWEVSLAKDVVVPYTHVVESLPSGMISEATSTVHVQNLTTLLFFAGNLQRKGMGAVRRQLADVLANAPDVIIRSANGGNVVTEQLERETAGEMRRARFCLHPAGDTPSSARIFDAIANLCVPVIVSDDIELPFEDLLDYGEFCVFVKERDAVQPGVLLQRLRTIPDGTLVRMRQRLAEVRDYFEYTEPWTRCASAQSLIWKEVAARVPSLRLRMARKRRETSREQAVTYDNIQPDRDFLPLVGNWSEK